MGANAEDFSLRGGDGRWRNARGQAPGKIARGMLVIPGCIISPDINRVGRHRNSVVIVISRFGLAKT
jgi:hypothetical protein